MRNAAKLLLVLVQGIILISCVSESNSSSIASEYAGQEQRTIKALSQDDVEGLLEGAWYSLWRYGQSG